jgi:hypothetical protein
MKMTLVEGAWFLMIFTNENTKVVWTHFLKSKSKSLATFKEFQAMVETNSRKKIKCIWNDNGKLQSERHSIAIYSTIQPIIKWCRQKAQLNFG